MGNGKELVLTVFTFFFIITVVMVGEKKNMHQKCKTAHKGTMHDFIEGTRFRISSVQIMLNSNKEVSGVPVSSDPFFVYALHLKKQLLIYRSVSDFHCSLLKLTF